MTWWQIAGVILGIWLLGNLAGGLVLAWWRHREHEEG